jgi:hypothetical protein
MPKNDTDANDNQVWRRGYEVRPTASRLARGDRRKAIPTIGSRGVSVVAQVRGLSETRGEAREGIVSAMKMCIV